MSRLNSKKIGYISSFVFCSLLVLFTLLFVFYRQRIIDQIAFWQYQPTSAIALLAERSSMNEKGKFYFYASQPVLDATQNFNDSCDKVEKTVSILGCYDGKNIYIFDVNKSQLDGIREVTAAHEMLHTVYVRLSSGDKSRIDKLLEDEYEKLKNDKDFAETMAFYEKNEPGQRNNELHSIIGTEISNISTELEEYYDQYFLDRQTVVALDAKYSGVFKELNTRINNLTSKLKNVSSEITLYTDEYNNKAENLNNDINNFNSRASSGYFSSMTQFYNERNQLSIRVAELDALRAKINSDIAIYNTALTEYNSIALESQALYSAINSTLAPAPKV